jgi:exoribonuclease R
MKAIKILIEDRNYVSWKFCYPDTNIPVTEKDVPELKNVNPIESKLFSRDIFIFKDSDLHITKSYLKNSTTIAGVLQLENNKTFGRTTNKKRLLYKCIPDDKHIPVFLVPYDVKMGFSKVQKNKYVIFKFDNWNDKHPHGTLIETLGDVDSLEAFYEYQLYCKSLYHSITEFTKKTRDELNKRTNEDFLEQIYKNKDFNIEDRRSEYIFTIDPLNSSDYDDGFSIKKTKEDNWLVTVYIANVYFWMETLGLWKSFSKRVATIYLPDRRRPMLPTILSDSLCSLQEKQQRFALAMDFIVNKQGEILNLNDIVYKNVLINVHKNYVYEDPKMLAKDNSYSDLFNLSIKMDNTIKDSHDIVAFWMVLMNMHTGLKMMKDKIGIFRSAKYINAEIVLKDEITVDSDSLRVIRSWNNISGQYVTYNDDIGNIVHEVMNLKSYIHITSPIRRLVDLLNQIMLIEKCSQVTNISNDAKEFLNNWIEQIDYLNTSMRSIRKIQTDCNVLAKCYNNPEIMEKQYDGVVFDKINKNDGLFSYMVYLKPLKLLSRITTTLDIQDYSTHEFKIFLFEDEENSKKKIRLQIKNGQ